MKKIFSLLILLYFYFPVSSQTPVGSWADHLAYSSANSVAISADEVYASTGSSLLIYNKNYSELKKMSKINGLSETGISNISWSEENKTLVIAYSNTNVDLLKNNEIQNLPDIKRKNISVDKKINKIRTNGKYAYCASGFGIIVIDLTRKEIYDTWAPGTGSGVTEARDVAFGNGKIFAATDEGVFSADITTEGLSYFGNWNKIPALPPGKYTSLVFSGNKLYANLSDPSLDGDRIFSLDNSVTLFSYLPGIYNKSFDGSSDGFTVSSNSGLNYYNLNGNLIGKISSYGWAAPEIVQAVADKNDIWIADKRSGLIRSESLTVFTSLTLPGPLSNRAFSITSSSGKTFICGGATDPGWNNEGKPLEISIFENNNWTSLTESSILDPVRTLIDPQNSNHFFVSTWGGGLLEYENNVLKNHYTDSNSPLQSMSPGRPYVRICGMAMDDAKNLWITQSGVNGSIKVLKPDGTWIVNPVIIDAPLAGDIIITSNGQKWIILPAGYGLFVLDDNNTPDNFSDDKFKRILIYDTENQPISQAYSIAEDLDGSIWVGTDQGPVIYFNPENIFNVTPKASRIKIPRNDGTNLADYMLKTEKITSMVIDGGNRKWLATGGSGAYLLSPDGTKQIKNFNEKNSPLFSDTIASISLDGKSGDVWFGTSKGVLSYRSDATQGSEKFSKVLIFPNPVRENFSGNVTVSGLLKDSQIRITDVSGNLVYETISTGGEATWDLATYNGRRVATGVYLVFCSSKDGSQTFVTKMLVIH